MLKALVLVSVGLLALASVGDCWGRYVSTNRPIPDEVLEAFRAVLPEIANQLNVDFPIRYRSVNDLVIENTENGFIANANVQIKPADPDVPEPDYFSNGASLTVSHTNGVPLLKNYFVGKAVGK